MGGPEQARLHQQPLPAQPLGGDCDKQPAKSFPGAAYSPYAPVTSPAGPRDHGNLTPPLYNMAEKACQAYHPAALCWFSTTPLRSVSTPSVSSFPLPTSLSSFLPLPPYRRSGPV